MELTQELLGPLLAGVQSVCACSRTTLALLYICDFVTHHAQCDVCCRQEERQEVEAVRLRLEAEAAARRKQRQQQLLAAQLEQVAAVQAR